MDALLMNIRGGQYHIFKLREEGRECEAIAQETGGKEVI